MKSVAGEGKPKELAQLLKLRKVQLDKSEAAMRLKRREVAEAEEDVRKAEVKLEEDKQAVRDFAAYIVGEGATELARMGDFIQSYRVHLKENVVRADEALAQAQDDLETRKQELHEAHTAWLRETARHDGVEAALKRSKAAAARAAEIKVEAEVDELKRAAPVAATTGEG